MEHTGIRLEKKAPKEFQNIINDIFIDT